jgi:hypothetical protein
MDPEYEILDGDVSLSVNEDDAVILLKAAATFGDPVELSPEAARELAAQLLAMADRLD